MLLIQWIGRPAADFVRVLDKARCCAVSKMASATDAGEPRLRPLLRDLGGLGDGHPVPLAIGDQLMPSADTA